MQDVCPHVPLLPSGINWYTQKLGSKQATIELHYTLAVVCNFGWCLAEGLDQLRTNSHSPVDDFAFLKLLTVSLVRRYRYVN